MDVFTRCSPVRCAAARMCAPISARTRPVPFFPARRGGLGSLGLFLALLWPGVALVRVDQLFGDQSSRPRPWPFPPSSAPKRTRFSAAVASLSARALALQARERDDVGQSCLLAGVHSAPSGTRAGRARAAKRLRMRPAARCLTESSIEGAESASIVTRLSPAIWTATASRRAPSSPATGASACSSAA